MNQYKKNIKSLIKNKYKEADYHNKKFLSDFRNFREFFRKKITRKSTSIQINEKMDKTLIELKKYYQNKEFNNKRIESFYKKFEVNLKLKQIYDKKFFLLTKKETSYQSYIYLGHLVIRLKTIDIFQKLNIILKILDKLCLSNNKYEYYDSSLLIKLIQIEQNLILKILK